ncbi:MAG: GNAT family N-acetyltransferase [Rhizobiaceae bacterium]|nr:GNAT family N-acetyltransferase [Rhizobiaceae bacterium]
MSDIAQPEPITVTVTFLDMERQPAFYPPLPYNRQIALLRTRAIPLHFYRYLLDRVGRKWNWVNALRLDDEELAAAIHAADRDIRVLYVDGAPAGFFDIKPARPEETEIAYFGMMEHATGQGLGRWFLGAAIAAAWSTGPQRVTVQTCTLDHPAALPLYQKMGFSPVAQATEVVHPMTLTDRSASVMRPAWK